MPQVSFNPTIAERIARQELPSVLIKLLEYVFSKITIAPKDFDFYEPEAPFNELSKHQIYITNRGLKTVPIHQRISAEQTITLTTHLHKTLWELFSDYLEEIELSKFDRIDILSIEKKSAASNHSIIARFTIYIECFYQRTHGFITNYHKFSTSVNLSPDYKRINLSRPPPEKIYIKTLDLTPLPITLDRLDVKNIMALFERILPSAYHLLYIAVTTSENLNIRYELLKFRKAFTALILTPEMQNAQAKLCAEYPVNNDTVKEIFDLLTPEFLIEKKLEIFPDIEEPTPMCAAGRSSLPHTSAYPTFASAPKARSLAERFQGLPPDMFTHLKTTILKGYYTNSLIELESFREMLLRAKEGDTIFEIKKNFCTPQSPTTVNVNSIIDEALSALRQDRKDLLFPN